MSLHTLSPALWLLLIPAGLVAVQIIPRLLFCLVSEAGGQLLAPRPSPSALFHLLIPERTQKHPEGVPAPHVQTCCHPLACSLFPTVQMHFSLDLQHLKIKLTVLSKVKLHDSHYPIFFQPVKLEAFDFFFSMPHPDCHKNPVASLGFFPPYFSFPFIANTPGPRLPASNTAPPPCLLRISGSGSRNLYFQ